MKMLTRLGRLQVERTLGSGSFGRVYLAWDEDRQQKIAIKQLTRLGPEGVFRFKQEFRLLADLHHPNLVSLYELVAEEGRLAFSMEYVDGKPFSTWVRRGAAPASDVSSTGRFRSGSSHPPAWEESPTLQSSSTGAIRLPEVPAVPLDSPDRLRLALARLVSGIQALHGAGILHLDLKSNNVLVTREGRVVILDFGLSREEEPQALTRGGELVQGTPSHVAPEIAMNLPATEASDWYSVGVMLFESLTGRLPFLGGAREMIAAKLEGEAPRPRDLCPELPEDLSSLCGALLRRDPKARAGAAEILAALGTQRPGDLDPVRPPLVGREGDMDALHEAQAGTRDGQFLMRVVSGPFGVGKSALLREFLKEVSRRDPRALPLLGRCFEQETMPFKGMDGLVDALSHHLRRRSAVEVASQLPPNLPLLAQLFPALRQVPSIAAAVEREAPEPQDPMEAPALRRLAFRALRALLANLAKERSVVLVLDDFQWAGPDTVSLLLEMVRPPEAPHLLLVIGCRTDGEAAPPPLATLLKGLREAGMPWEERTLEPLSADLSEALALSLTADLGQAGAIARESGGFPWLIHELALQQGQTEGVDALPVSYPRIVRERLAHLPEEAREILRLLSIAGYPLAWNLVRRAVPETLRGPDPVALLRTHHLAHLRGKPSSRVLEVYHDRVRNVILEGLSSREVAEGHLRLIRAMEASGQGGDSQILSYHYLGAGETALAAHHSAEAARRSEAALAFDRAAALYRRAIALRPEGDPRTPELRIRLASALVNTGHSWEAAQEFLALAQERPGEARRYRRRAAEELFRSGHLAQAQALGASVLEELGLRYPATPFRALASLVYHRFLLTLRGTSFQERSEAEIPHDQLERADALWSMAMGLGPFDLTRATDFQTRFLLEALKAGEPVRVVRGMAHETALRSAAGNKAVRAVKGLLFRTLALAERLGQPEAVARGQLAAAISATAQGRWRAAAEWAARAETTLGLVRCGVVYETHLARYYRLRNLHLLGEFQEAQEGYAGLLQEARDQGDRLTATNLMIDVGSLLLLGAGRPGEAHEVLDQALAGWPREPYLLQHLMCLNSRCAVLLYEGREAEALAEVLAQWRDLKGSFLLQAEALRVTSLELRVRVLLASGRDRDALRWNRLLGRERTEYARGLALKNLGVLIVREGRKESGANCLFEAELALEAAELHLHARCLRWARGAVLGNGSGKAFQEEAEAWMRARGVADPGRMVRTLVPGLTRDTEQRTPGQ